MAAPAFLVLADFPASMTRFPALWMPLASPPPAFPVYPARVADSTPGAFLGTAIFAG